MSRKPPEDMPREPGDPVLVGRGGGNGGAHVNSRSETFSPMATRPQRSAVTGGAWTVRRGEEEVLALVGALKAGSGLAMSIRTDTALAGMVMNRMREVARDHGCLLEIGFHSPDMDNLGMTVTVRRNDGKDRE